MADDDACAYDPVGDEPSVYLRPPVTPDEHLLTEQVGLHDGAPVPFWMFAKLSLRARRQAQWIGRFDGFLRRVRRHARVALAALAANLMAIAGFALHRAAAEGAAEERELARDRDQLEYRKAIDQRLRDLREDIREVRADFRRFTGAEPSQGPSTDDEVPDPDKYSLLDGSSPLLTAGALSGAVSEIGPRLCGDTCDSSLQCASHFGRVCPFCSFGSCSATTPALVGQGVLVTANGASATLTPLPEPGTLDKDTCLAFAFTNSLTPGGGAGTQTITCSAGWTLVTNGQITNSGFTSTWAIYKRLVPNGEVETNTVSPSVNAAAAAPTFTIANGGDSLAQVFTVRGPTPGNQDVDASASFNALGSFGTGPFTVPTWSTNTDNDLVLYIVGGAGSAGNIATLTVAGVTGLTRVGETSFAFSSGDTVGWSIHVGTRPSHGAIGTGTLSFGAGTIPIASAVALKPA